MNGYVVEYTVGKQTKTMGPFASQDAAKKWILAMIAKPEYKGALFHITRAAVHDADLRKPQ